MAKISPVAAKYIIHTSINIDGVVDRPDVIGAIFGQTEGLLGSDLELRELQRSGRIGRIEVNVNTSSGKTNGEIIIPSSLDKTETAIVAAAMEIIQRIGPCNAKIQVKNIEDVRISKRQFVIERAKALLKELTDNTLPDSQELADEVSQSVRMLEVMEYGRERLAAGPAVDESDELIIVEGRADVLNLLKNGFKNVIAMNGTSVPETVKELTKKKTTTIFVDGDRGGDLIIRELFSVADVDFVCKAPDGKEVEELTKKEIHKGLRGRITAEQAKLDLGIDDQGVLREDHPQNLYSENGTKRQFSTKKIMEIPSSAPSRPVTTSPVMPKPLLSRSYTPPPLTAKPSFNASPISVQRRISDEEKGLFKRTLEDLFGTRGACIFDQKLNLLGKVPLSELETTLKSLSGGIYALALDGSIDIDLVRLAEKVGIRHLIGTTSKVKETARVNIVTDEMLV